MEKISPRRPRADNASQKAAASIEEAERLGLVPVAVLDDDALADSFGTRETDHRLNPPRQSDGPLPFKVSSK